MKLSNIQLIITNLIIIFLAIFQNWNFQEILLSYWIQSIIIGIFQIFKIIDLKNFSTQGFLINDHPVQPTFGTKLYTAFFFAIHYGIFHLAYLAFITSPNFYSNTSNLNLNIQIDSFKYNNLNPSVFSSPNTSILILPALIFFINHLISFFSNRQTDRNSNKNIGSLMFVPYTRIIPMHLTLMFGFALGLPKLFFLIIRALVDYYSHLFEHKTSRSNYF